MIMKADKLLLEFESLCEQAGYTVRKERGTFKGDHCIFEGDKLIMVNKSRPVEIQAAVLANVLKKLNTDDMFIKPAVRKQLEDLWAKMERFKDAIPEDESSS